MNFLPVGSGFVTVGVSPGSALSVGVERNTRGRGVARGMRNDINFLRLGLRVCSSASEKISTNT
jgi:hypothetical protein